MNDRMHFMQCRSKLGWLTGLEIMNISMFRGHSRDLAMSEVASFQARLSWCKLNKKPGLTNSDFEKSKGPYPSGLCSSLV